MITYRYTASRCSTWCQVRTYIFIYVYVDVYVYTYHRSIDAVSMMIPMHGCLIDPQHFRGSNFPTRDKTTTKEKQPPKNLGAASSHHRSDFAARCAILSLQQGGEIQGSHCIAIYLYSSSVLLSPRTRLLLLRAMDPASSKLSHGQRARAGYKATLEFALRPYRIPPDTLREKHEAVLGMVTIFLGESGGLRSPTA